MYYIGQRIPLQGKGGIRKQSLITIYQQGGGGMATSGKGGESPIDYSAIRKMLRKIFPNNPQLVSIIMTLLKILGPVVLTWFGLSQSGLM